MILAKQVCGGIKISGWLKAAGILGGEKLRQLTDAGLAVVEEDAIHGMPKNMTCDLCGEVIKRGEPVRLEENYLGDTVVVQEGCYPDWQKV